MSNRSQSAIAAAITVARREGLSVDDPVVMRDAWHVLVHLRPSPIVARVSAPPIPGGPKADDVIRELAVASHAARRGAPIIPPSDEIHAGPHEENGHVVTFWRYVEPVGEVDAQAAGHGLREIHEALSDYDGPLPAAGHPEDVREMLQSLDESDDVAFLRRVASISPQVNGQALHGDAHLFNCLATRDGPLWHDFETACSAPREYDLAALIIRDLSDGGDPAARTALRAYGEHDADLLRAFIPVYAVWVYASFLAALPRRPELRPVIRARLDWLRSYVDASS
jgi:phosphotransferase family enzyme